METRISSVKKRDGRVVPFDRNKIAEAIFKAARSVGGSDRHLAEDLAEAVTLYIEKEFRDRTPAVEEIQDIVERVLIKTGHARTAKSYILYREKRARVRRVRQGISREELAREQQAMENLKEETSFTLPVKGSNETIEGWDRERIVHALVKETGISYAIAEVIALEVEELVIASKITHSTASLIRELVNAKLVEYGFPDARRKHARLGLPLHDARDLILASPSDPAGSCAQLGQHIKKEFSLLEVFSAEVTDAHLKGDIHLHGLEQVDRFHYCIWNSGYLQKFGFQMPGCAPRIPRTCGDLADQVCKFSQRLQNCFHRGMCLEGMNLFPAPMTKGLAEADLKEFIRDLLGDLHFQEHLHPGTLSLGIHLGMPDCLEESVLPGYQGEGSEGTCGQFREEIERSAETWMRVLLEERDLCGLPVFLHVPPAFLCGETDGGFARMIGTLAMQRPETHVVFQGERTRFGGWHTCEPSPSEFPTASWDLRFVYSEQITLNLPRMTYLAEGNEDIFFHLLNRSLDVAVQGHIEKRSFLDRLLSRGERGPLGVLASWKDGQPFVPSSRPPVNIVGILGLNESAYYHTGCRLHQTGESWPFAVKVLTHLRDSCERLARQTGQVFHLAQTNDTEPARRFTRLDLEYFPDHADQVLAGNPSPWYGSSLLDMGSEPLALERLEKEVELHAFFDSGARTVLPVSGIGSTQDIADFLQTVSGLGKTACLTFR